MMTVEQLMKREHLVTAHATSAVRDAFDQMSEAGVRHLPVVDGAGRLIGIVSQRDLARSLDVMRTAEGERAQLRVGDVMRREVLRARPGLPAHQAAAMMIESKIGALPVVGDDGALVGIITETDFLEVAREALAGEGPAARARA
jgi:CBS domain-containing protein